MTVCSASRWEEPDFTASANVVEAGCRAIREGKTKYSENAGLLALRQAIARYLARTEGLSYNPASQIVVTPGAMGALFLALKVLLNPGDEVIVNEPCWTNYIQQIRMCGGVPVSVKTVHSGGLIWMYPLLPRPSPARQRRSF